MRRIIAHVLRGAGFDAILESDDAESALEHIRDEEHKNLDLVITEWDLPSGSGLELIKELREGEGSSEIPILLVTLRNSREEVLQAIEAGVDGYVLKPFTPEILKAKIDYALQSKRDEGSSTSEAA
jgi:two-component system chemotaxis response regulator CheY